MKLIKNSFNRCCPYAGNKQKVPPSGVDENSCLNCPFYATIIPFAEPFCSKASSLPGYPFVSHSSMPNILSLPAHAAKKIEEILRMRAKSETTFSIMKLDDGKEIKILKTGNSAIIVDLGTDDQAMLEAMLDEEDASLSPLSGADFKTMVAKNTNNREIRLASFLVDAVDVLSMAEYPWIPGAALVDILTIDNAVFKRASLPDRNLSLDPEVLKGKQQLNHLLFSGNSKRHLDGYLQAREMPFFSVSTLMNVLGWFFAFDLLNTEVSEQQELVAKFVTNKRDAELRAKDLGKICHKANNGVDIKYAKEGDFFFTPQMHSCMRFYCNLYRTKK